MTRCWTDRQSDSVGERTQLPVSERKEQPSSCWEAAGLTIQLTELLTKPPDRLTFE